MELNIFDVEHGQCSLIKSKTGCIALIDAGTNSTTGWRPSDHLARLGYSYIERLYVTNFDADHTSDLENLERNFHIGRFERNQSISGDDFYALKQAGMDSGLRTAMYMTTKYVHPSPEDDFGDISFTTYYNIYSNEIKDTNNLSMVVFVEHPSVKLCFPGDLEQKGWEALLQRQSFRNEFSNVDILIASHHGRANGCSDAIFSSANCVPDIVIISDAGKQFSSQETADWYAARVKGIPFNNGTIRKVLTTRKDGKIAISPTLGGGYHITTGA